MARTRLSNRNWRYSVAACNALTWISSAIVVGITSHFINDYPHDQHLIYELVISAIVLGLWLPSFILPIVTRYKFYYGPLNFVFSYLWLTAFIFAAQDYNESQCQLNAPFGGSCSLKLTNEAFIFIAFFFSLVASLIDAYAYHTARVIAAEPVHPEKPDHDNAPAVTPAHAAI
ncbi:hypothetical protein N0V83_001043 [Neocucurbitaria cava]|uniref:MARVEL domain-containing protein n=1 Tax=Neocucurbitaria cava TaxID=798079 RepID=A0A9W8YEU8_9PLEO|nr:hypothetical protein N0V83_001043 [Neocucurbitaria cava]